MRTPGHQSSLERPTLTLHGTGDLFVPILEQSLKRAVVAAGKDARLTQRIYRIAGHCGFSQPEMIKAFDELARPATRYRFLPTDR